MRTPFTSSRAMALTLALDARAARRPGASGGWGRRRGLHLDADVLLGGHRDPQDRVDQDLAAGDDQEQQEEEEPGSPGAEAETAAEAGEDTAQDPPFLGPDESVPGEALADVVHGGARPSW